MKTRIVFLQAKSGYLALMEDRCYGDLAGTRATGTAIAHGVNEKSWGALYIKKFQVAETVPNYFKNYVTVER